MLNVLPTNSVTGHTYHIISYHIISYHIISYHIISYHITSHHITSHHIISYHIISYHIIFFWLMNLWAIKLCTLESPHTAQASRHAFWPQGLQQKRRILANTSDGQSALFPKQNLIQIQPPHRLNRHNKFRIAHDHNIKDPT